MESSRSGLVSLVALILVTVLFPTCMFGQSLSVADQGILNSARSKYYDLEAHGFVSATCRVIFDGSTVPLLSLDDKTDDLRLLQASRFTLTLNRMGATLLRTYPPGTSAASKLRVAQETSVLTSLVTGMFRTWFSKGFNGPIPPFDSQVEAVRRKSAGYTVTIRSTGLPSEVMLDDAFLVTEIVSDGGKIDEKPVYMPTADGLIFSSNSAVALNDSEHGGRMEIHYQITNAIMDGLWLPSAVHLQVDRNIDLKFTLNECLVKKGIVVSILPPESKKRNQ